MRGKLYLAAAVVATAGWLTGCGGGSREVEVEIPTDPQTQALQQQMLNQLQSLQGRTPPPPGVGQTPQTPAP